MGNIHGEGLTQASQEASSIALLAESLIPQPDLTWTVSSEVLADPGDTFVLIKKLGLTGSEEDGGESGIGWCIPRRFDAILPTRLRSVTEREIDAARDLEVGMHLKDFGKDASVVVEGIVENPDGSGAILLKSHRPQKSPDKEPLRYVYGINVRAGQQRGVTVVEGTMRAVNAGPILRAIGPSADRKAINLLTEGLTEYLNPKEARRMAIQRTKRHAGYAAAAGVGLVGWRLLQNRSTS